MILRKNGQSNRSDRGATTQAVLMRVYQAVLLSVNQAVLMRGYQAVPMSVYRTLRLRGHDPLEALTATLHTYLQTGQLPPLPPQAAANG